MFLARRQLRFARGRTLSMGAVVALVAMLVAVVTGFTNGLTTDTISAIRALPASNLVFAADATSAEFTRSVVDQQMIDGWRARLGDDVTPFGTAITSGRNQRGTDVEVTLFGIELGSFIAPAVREGRPLRGGSGVVVSKQVADAGVEVGDVLTINRLGIELPVIGVTGPSSLGHVPVVYAPLRVWQRVRFGLPGSATPPSAFHQATGLAVRDTVAGSARLDRELGTKTMTRRASYTGAPGYEGETTIMTTIRVFLYVISALVVGAFFVVLTGQRQGEIALLKAIGGSPGYILKSLVSEVASLIVPAVAAGCLVATGLGMLLSHSVPFDLEPSSTVATAILLIATGLGAVLVTGRRAASVEALIALGGSR